MRKSSMPDRSRVIAGVIGAMLLIIVLFSAFYMVAEAEHECSGEDCAICACIRHCENTLRGIGDGFAAASAVFAPAVLILIAAVFAFAAASRDTLISRKVRLNN